MMQAKASSRNRQDAIKLSKGEKTLAKKDKTPCYTINFDIQSLKQAQSSSSSLLTQKEIFLSPRDSQSGISKAYQKSQANQELSQVSNDYDYMRKSSESRKPKQQQNSEDPGKYCRLRYFQPITSQFSNNQSKNHSKKLTANSSINISQVIQINQTNHTYISCQHPRGLAATGDVSSRSPSQVVYTMKGSRSKENTPKRTRASFDCSRTLCVTEKQNSRVMQPQTSGNEAKVINHLRKFYD